MPLTSVDDRHGDRMRRHGDRGFTLLELLVVLTFAVMVTSVAGTTFAAREQSMDDTASDVVRFLRHSRHEALVTGQDTLIRIDRAQGVMSRDGADDLSLGAGTGIIVQMPDGLEAAERGTLVFYAAGGASGATILLQRNGQERKLHLSWLTGAVSTVQDPS